MITHVALQRADVIHHLSHVFLYDIQIIPNWLHRVSDYVTQGHSQPIRRAVQLRLCHDAVLPVVVRIIFDQSDCYKDDLRTRTLFIASYDTESNV